MTLRNILVLHIITIRISCARPTFALRLFPASGMTLIRLACALVATLLAGGSDALAFRGVVRPFFHATGLRPSARANLAKSAALVTELPADVDAIARKQGLEVAIWKTFRGSGSPSKTAPSKTAQAKALFARYGGAYLLTSISFALLSYTVCDADPDVFVRMPRAMGRRYTARHNIITHSFSTMCMRRCALRSFPKASQSPRCFGGSASRRWSLRLRGKRR
jgi:hypothetical protein